MTIPSETFLTTREVAALLRIKERKVYDLVAKRQIPCTRATGKLLFSKTAIDAWLTSTRSGPEAGSIESPLPNVILGSHDPLLDWALQESRCGLATQFGGSSDGLDRFAERGGVASSLHLYDPKADSWNISEVQHRFKDQPVALVEFCWRERGVIVKPEFQTQIRSPADLKGLRLVQRQPGTGSEILLGCLFARDQIDMGSVSFTAQAHTETEAASAVLEDLADAALGLRAMAERFRLAFVPLMRERFDLIVNRKSWFDEPLQLLAEFCRSQEFKSKARSMPGYDASRFGRVHFNG